MREMTTYKSEPGVAPVKVVSLRAVKRRAKRGILEVEQAIWTDLFENLADRR